MEQERSYDLFPEADQQFAEELMMQEELMLLQSGEADVPTEATVVDSVVTDLVPGDDALPTLLDDELVEPIDDDVIVESGSTSWMRNLFANPKIKWAILAAIAIFAIWLVTSGVLWAIIKWIFQLVVGLITLAIIIYIIKEWIL